MTAAMPDWNARVVIDEPDGLGSDPGAWATAIAHTPHLAAQCRGTGERDAYEDTNVND